MKLPEIFAQGHGMAVARNPMRRVVRIDQPAERVGYWVVSPSALPAIGVRKKAEQGDLLARLAPTDEAAEWQIDHAHCWCAKCVESRRLSQTDSGDL